MSAYLPCQVVTPALATFSASRPGLLRATAAGSQNYGQAAVNGTTATPWDQTDDQRSPLGKQLSFESAEKTDSS